MQERCFTKTFTVADMTSLDNHRIFITPKAGSSQDELRSKIADGIPFIHMGYEERHCQYGRSFNKAKKV